MKTIELFKEMKKQGYNVKLMYLYDNNYNQDYNYIGIHIRTSDIDEEKLFEFVREFGKATLEKVTNIYDKESYYVYQLRRNYRDAELIEQEGVNYQSLARREKMNYDTQTIISYEDWKNILNDFS